MTTTPETPALTYAEAGVDTAAGDKAVELMKAAVSATHGPEVLGGVGAFAGLVDVSALKDFERPLLASSTDGVGTKIAIARALDVHDTIGQDLVGMVVDDIVVVGARPLAMTDYIACGKVVPERIADIVRGIAEGCRLAGCALVGGETAEHPGLMAPEDYDVAGAAVGVVEASAMLGAHRVRPGDRIIGMDSSGLHSNGYSLVRAVIEAAGLGLDAEIPELGRTLGAELLEPTRIYTGDLLALLDDPAGEGVHALSHVTGGGLAANLARVLPEGTTAVVDRGAWRPAAIFERVSTWGGVPLHDLEATLNMGIGMVAAVAPEQADAAVGLLGSRGLPSRVIGEVVAGDDAPRPTGQDVLVSGAKGVDGGGVLLTGMHEGWS
ncbi:phosphoribosylformylglycinamidine cyclo-ligase [Brachybacterium halotolerans subsp. kimchii]|uniref:Phosphoribosylformylglycinamidine cyclo-ligase n=1 Tax=Brachybacterium halotolerans TaxID=2795215 RepID=A0ABS1BDM7_9MICO|nr:phosphoribosylformylglycinamidine cyclo-ligase [Brachybacterium halotolerans]MBK0332745.1 phosphoribosylformylglycinamidine cyclo-ligase [Brachybacterium halotolerans]UEJ82224.1 phosphoribosylformylglycinamidine cyclo-ligase [Brachybacterium halotolerans subsp. kimchii]